ATPTLTATFLDGDSQDTGKVTIEVCSTSNCSSSLGTFDSSSTSLAVNANGSAAVPAGYNLASGPTYYWRAKTVDSSAASPPFSGVHHLDTLALTYTKPGSDPMVRDTALATGNAAGTATLLSGSITNNTTNVSPSTPTLVGPADAARLNTATPTLTATFLDQD